MRRFVGLFVVLFFSVPFGISIAGCSKPSTVVFCNGGDSGPAVGQLTTLTLAPVIFGISLDNGAFGQVTSPSGADCKGNAVTLSQITYGIRPEDVGLVDVVPTGASAGRLCAGTFNRNTGGGIADYTVCNPTTRTGTAYVTASSGGAVSNALPIFVHPVVTAISVGPKSTNCATDLATNCCAFSTVGGVTQPSGTYTGESCLSQNVAGQLAARVYTGSGTSLRNVTCSAVGTDNTGATVYAPLVGHLTYTPQDATVVTIDENGIATAKYPGSTVVSATIANGTSVIASSTAGYFSTCPPTSITLGAANVSGSAVTVNQNNVQPLTAIATDKNGATLNGLSLEFVSSTPRTLPNGTSGSVTPVFPGSGEVTAICTPPTCNNAPLNQLGLNGNGKPITSNQLVINTPGTNSSVLYAASTQSLYLSITDFATSNAGSIVRLPYLPNSMVLSTDGNSLYLGSDTELMLVSATNGAVAGQFVAARGQVLTVSPDNSTVIVTDPTRQTISLVSSAGAVTSTYGGVGTHAQFSPDSTTAYITAGNNLVVHSTYTGWTTIPLTTAATDVSVANPAVGAFLAGATTTARSYCPITTTSGTGATATASNQYYPDAGVAGETTDRLTTTNDGRHVIGASITPNPTLTDFYLPNGVPVGACPLTGSVQFNTTAIDRAVLPGVTASAITGVDVATDSTYAFITYVGSGGVLPYYLPTGASAGTLGSLTLSGTAVAPIAGVLASDNNTFFVGTTGDDLVHLITRGATGFTDSKTFNPQVVDESGAPVPRQFAAATSTQDHLSNSSCSRQERDGRITQPSRSLCFRTVREL